MQVGHRFVQRPKGSTDPAGRPSARASVLYDLVHSRNHQALDFFLVLSSRAPVLRLRREDGSGVNWTRPGAEEEEGPGYFVIPRAWVETPQSTE